MKKKITFLTGIIVLLFSINVYATTKAEVSFKVNSEFKEGNTVDLIIDVKDVDRLYGGQMDFLYNSEYIKINSIEKGEIFKTIEDEPFDGVETDKGGGHAQIFFSFMGDNYGLKGSGELIKINLTVLKDGKLNIDENNMVIKLIERQEGKDPGYMDFKRNNISLGNGDDIPSSKPDSNNSSDNNVGNSTNTNNNDNESNTQENNGEGESGSTEDKLESNNNESNKLLDSKSEANTKEATGIIVALLFIIGVIGAIIYTKKQKSK